MHPALAAIVPLILLFAIASGVFWWLRPPSVHEIARDYAAYVARHLRVDHETAEPSALEGYFVQFQEYRLKSPI